MGKGPLTPSGPLINFHPAPTTTQFFFHLNIFQQPLNILRNAVIHILYVEKSIDLVSQFCAILEFIIFFNTRKPFALGGKIQCCLWLFIVCF